MSEFSRLVLDEFGERVVFIGLQGSTARGERQRDSDIDVVVVLDRLLYDDVARYRAAIADINGRALVCGFVSGRDELMRWSRQELFQFVNDTDAFYGSLDFVGDISEDDIRLGVLTGTCSVYHGAVHCACHERDAGALPSLFKAATIAIQAVYYLRSGRYVRLKKELAPLCDGREREIVSASEENFFPPLDDSLRLLIEWASEAIAEYSLSD